MSKRSAEDTISGYYYQFDKTIIELLDKEDNGDVTVEGIEDIDIERLNGDQIAIQVKYHAKTKYVPSAIKEPIQKLLNEYKKSKDDGKDLKFKLYAHFKEGQEALNSKLNDGKIKESELTFVKEKLLSGKKDGIEYSLHEDLGVDDEYIKAFMDSLIIEINAKDIDGQGKEVIEKIRKTFDNCDYRIAENYYYNNALKIIFDLAIKSNVEDRKINKDKFVKAIDKKKFLFNKWFAHLKGKKRYLEYIKWNLKRSKALSTTKYKYLFIGKEFLDFPDSETTLESLIKNIIDEYFQLGKAFSLKNKVWTVVLDCDDAKLSEYKKILSASKIKYSAKDTNIGFDINEFNEDPVINTKNNDRLDKASFQIKLITFEDFKVNQENIKKIDVSIFFSKTPFEEYFRLDEDIETLPIKKGCQLFIVEPDSKIKSLSDINSIFDEIISGNDYLRISSVQPNLIQVEVIDPVKFKEKNESFSIGSFVKITDENNNSIIGMLQSYKIRDAFEEETTIEKKNPSFFLDIQVLGYMHGDEFRRGGHEITIPPSEVSVADSALLKQIFSLGHEKNRNKIFSFGTLAFNDEVDVVLNGNNFFNKHIALVGSTGSGKSCTVAKVLQSGIEVSEEQKGADKINNSRIIIFDLHGEYKQAFPNCNYLSVDKLVLPYWLLNGEELADLFIDSSEFSSHNQFNQLKDAIILNKKKYNPTKKVDFDTPAYFSFNEIIHFVQNLVRERIYSSTGTPAVEGVAQADFTFEKYFEPNLSFSTATSGTDKTKSGRFNDFERFLTRLQSKKNDERLDFMLEKGEGVQTDKLEEIIKQFLGYSKSETGDEKKSNITIIDLSGISFDVLSVVVSLVSRLMFNFMYYSKKSNEDEEIRNPLLLVFEEAHNYIPKSSEVKYRAVKESIERIAKEGRKYGICSMIVSQRPSEISETIFSQCNSFIVMRLTNPTDQNYIKKLLPDSVSSITDNLSGLESREALVLGSSIPLPTIIKVNEVADHIRPKSTDVNFMEKWKDDWRSISDISTIIDKMVKPLPS